MGMRIRTNVPSITAQRFMEQNTDRVNASFEKLASGYRITRAADDAAGLAISEGLRARIRGMAAAKRNANDAISMLQVAENGMNEMTNILIRLREITLQAATDTLSNRERAFLNREYRELVGEIDRIALTTEFNGRVFFDPDFDTDEYIIQVGTNNTPPESNTDTMKIDLAGLKFNSVVLGLGNGAEIGPTDPDANDGPARNQIAEKLTVCDNALNHIARERAALGAMQNRLTSAIINLTSGIETQEQARSRIRDVDFAAETSELASSSILQKSNTSILAQCNQAPELALSLLQR